MAAPKKSLPDNVVMIRIESAFPHLSISPVTLPVTFESYNDGYTNSISPAVEMMITHPEDYLWYSGKFEDTSFDFKVFAGDADDAGSPTRKTAANLRAAIAQLFRLALNPTAKDYGAAKDQLGAGKGVTKKMSFVKIYLGSSWVKTGFIKNLTCKWLMPFDAQSNPYIADIHIVFTPMFTVMPTAANFNFTLA